MAHDELIHKLRQEWKRIRRELRKVLNRAQLDSAWNTVQRLRKDALAGGPIKRLFSDPFITNPPYLRRDDDNDTLADAPPDKLAVWTTHFERLLTREDPPHSLKPWMTCSVAQRYAQEAQAEGHFQWPQLLTTDLVITRLRKGNKRPSPGPDNWEKWALAQATRPFLNLVVSLCNFTIQHCYFPAALMENYIVPLYKRGDSTRPSNYRGIVLSNCLYQLISGWFAHCLQEHAWKRGMLSATQSATQRGVRPGDMVHLINQAHWAADALGETIYVMKRDHTKGFDYLHSSAFEDALKFFGFDDNVADFERARTAGCTLRVKCQDGIAPDTITTSGQTKQGDVMSPLKYTLAMSMCAHYMMSDTGMQSHMPILRTVASNQNHRHTTADLIRLRLGILEAMDDSLLLAKSWRDLKYLLSRSEMFQNAYGITTAWDSPDKTVCFTLGKALLTPTANVLFEDPSLPDGRVVVPFTNTPHFLRTPLTNHTTMYNAVMADIEKFPLRTDKYCPISLIRRAVMIILLPVVQGRLHLHPITHRQAQIVEQALSNKIMAALDLQATQTSLLTLPPSKMGFGFPSISDVNGKAAVDYVLRALNHHLQPYRLMARITLANIQCQLNDCVPPLADPRPGKPPQHRRIIPPTWGAARAYLTDSRMKIVCTDQEIHGTQGLIHLVNRLKASGDFTPSRELGQHIRHAGNARIQAREWAVKVADGTFDDRPWEAEAWRLAHMIVLPTIQALTPTDPMGHLSRNKRKEAYRSKATLAFAIGRDELRDYREPGTDWATDGSVIPASGMATAAIVGPEVAAMRMSPLQMMSSNEAEKMAMTAALDRIARQRASGIQRVYTDSMAAVREMASSKEEDVRKPYTRPHQGTLSEWMTTALRECEGAGVRVEIAHVKAHTDGSDRPSDMNRQADKLAKVAHDTMSVVTLPPTTALMRSYTTWIQGKGYSTETGWIKELMEEMENRRWRMAHSSFAHVLRDDDLDDAQLIPTYLYYKSPAVISTRVQLMTRTGQYPTARLRFLAGTSSTETCEYCRGAVQDMRHLFRDCPRFDDNRANWLDAWVGKWSDRDRDKDSGHAGSEDGRKEKQDHEALAVDMRRLLERTRDEGQFWLGHVPRILTPETTTYAARHAHMFAVTMTAHIAGIHLRDQAQVAKRSRERFRELSARRA